VRGIALSAGIGIALLLAVETSAMAQVQMIEVSKEIDYVQTSAGTVTVSPSPTPCFGCPYTFHADVRGSNIGGLSPAPTVSGPIDTGSLGPF